MSFCTHAIQQRDLYVVPDARNNATFRDNPFVAAEDGIRFYAGAPLVTPQGYALGTLCVLDKVPRTLTPEQVEALDALRRQAEAQLELRANLFELEARRSPIATAPKRPRSSSSKSCARRSTTSTS